MPSFTKDDAELYYRRGLVKSRLGEFENALVDFDKTVALNPTHTKALFSRGFCKSRLGNSKQAVADLDKAIEIGGTPTTTKAYYSDFITSSTLQLLGSIVQDRYKSTELSDDRADAYLVRGVLKNSTGDNRVALQDLNRAVELNPTNPEAYFIRGMVRSSLGDQKGSLIDCNSTIKLNPRHAEAYYLRGIIRYDSGDESAACIDLSRAGELGYSPAYKIITTRCNNIQRPTASR